MKHRHFRFYNPSNVSGVVVGLLAVCFTIMSLLTGYFISISTDGVSSVSDPMIDDVVRPSSIRAIYGASIERSSRSNR